MKIEQEQPTVLPWHREAAKDVERRLIENESINKAETAAIIARHDPAPLSLVEKKIAYLHAQHAETLRLLEEAQAKLDFGYLEASCSDLNERIRAHLAAQGGGK